MQRKENRRTTSERKGENLSSLGLLVAARAAGRHWAIDSAEAGVAALWTEQLLEGELRTTVAACPWALVEMVLCSLDPWKVAKPKS